VPLKGHIFQLCWPDIPALFFILSACAWSGCFRAVIVDRTSIVDNTEDDIVVSTTEGDQIRFAGGNYHIVVDEGGEEVIQGKGRRFLRGQSQFERFEGRIPVSHVLQISTSETTTMLYVGIGVIGLMLAFGIVIATSLHGGGFGG